MFALFDYIRYARTPGRFGIRGGISIMRQAFRGHIPGSLLEKLRPGDLFFVQTLDSWLSWMIMYLTHSEFSHVAMYEGGRRVSHATLGGVVSSSVDAIVRPDTLVVPCGLRLNPEQQNRIGQLVAQYKGAPYDWSLVIRKGLSILIGREPTYFRLTFFCDLGVLLAILDVPTLLITGRVIFLWLLLAYALVVATNALIAFMRPVRIDRRTVKPVEVFLLAWQMEADFYLAPNEIGEQ